MYLLGSYIIPREINKFRYRRVQAHFRNDLASDGSPIMSNAVSVEVRDAGQSFGIAADGAGAGRVNPALVYLAGLHSELSRISMRSKLNVVARLLGWRDLHDCPWSELKPEHVIGLMTTLEASGGKSEEKPGRAGSTINCYLAALKGVAKAAWLAGQMVHENYLRITAVKEVRYVRNPAGRSLTFRESRIMLSHWDPKRTIDVRDQAILMLMLGCGLRRGEIPGLLAERYDPDEGALTLIGKGDKERKVFLPMEVQQALDEWIERFRGDQRGRIFGRIRRNGLLDLSRPLDARSVGMIVQNRLKGAGIAGRLTAHDLRRTFATRLLDDGIDITTVKNMMGHANITTTARYDRRGEEVQKRAARGIRL